MSARVTNANSQIVRVAVPVPLRKAFDYLVPLTLCPNDSWIGRRVLVPFARRKHVAVVLSVHATSDVPRAKLKSILELIDEQAVIDANMQLLANWMAKYYLHPIGEVFATILPGALRKGANAAPEDEPYLCKNFAELTAIQVQLQQAKKQLALCAQLAGRDIPLNEAKQSFSGAVINELIKKDLIIKKLVPFAANTSWSQNLIFGEKNPANIEQSIAISAINQANSFATFLLEGVTGSGKTEVYLQVIEPVLIAQKQVLILVPEIGLTPQTVSRFEQRFGPIVGVLHSGLNETQRLRVWQQAKNNEIGIVIGTRSSIFVPLAKPGMIIVDEEHDESFKQQDNLKYHARDIAVYRAKQLDIPLIMGSATPSLETLHNALNKRYHHLQLSERAANASMPTQLLLDVKGQHLEYGIAPGLIEKMRGQLKQGNQVLIFVHRRGFSPALLCHQCGHVETCKACDNPFTLHKVSNNMQCHRCGAQQSIPKSCKECSTPSLDIFGLGTEQIETGSQEIFSEYSYFRIDRESTSRQHTP